MLEQFVADRLQHLVAPDARCLIAVSGGPDSLALLDLLHLGSARHRCALVVGHVDHGIDPRSGDVAEQVRGAAASRELPFHVRRLGLALGTSETAARRARQAALRAMAADTSSTAIILAHHADDQAETVLLRLLRGSGPAGLSGMADRRGPWVRPLLEVRRATLAAHLASRGIVAWTDPANSDSRHLRSWLRAEIVPRLTARLPDAIIRIDGAAAQARSARVAWSQLIEALPALNRERTRRGISVAAVVLQGYRSELRHAILAAIGRQLGVLLGARRLAAVDRLLTSRSGGGEVTLAAEYRAELAFGRLTLYRTEKAAVAAVPLAPGVAAAAGAGRFDIRVAPAARADRGGWSVALTPGRYTARRWQPGDRIRPLGGAGSRAVAVLLREARIPPGQRASWPVVVNADDATIVWVPGICRADCQVPAEGTEAWRVECDFS